MAKRNEGATSWVVSTAKALNSHLPFDSNQAILFVPASCGKNGGKGSTRLTQLETPDAKGDTKAGITGDEARRFYEDIISRPGNSRAQRRVKASKGQRQKTKADGGKELELKKRRRGVRCEKGPVPPSKRMNIDSCSVSKGQLFKLAQEGDMDALHSALSEGSHDINVTDHFNWTLLMCAAHAGHVTMVQYLLGNGARWKDCVDRKGNTAPDLAKLNKHLDIAELIEGYDEGREEEDGVEVEREGVGRDGKRTHAPSEPRDREKTFYCKICKMDVASSRPSSSLDKHETSVLHQFSCQHLPSVSPYVIPQSNRGYQLLLRGGWDPVSGLGSQRQGQRYPVKTVLKQDRRGFGEPTTEGRGLPRVTHFTAYDADAVKSSRERSGVCVTGPVQRKKRDVLKAVEKERRWEMRLRRYMNSD